MSHWNFRINGYTVDGSYLKGLFHPAKKNLEFFDMDTQHDGLEKIMIFVNASILYSLGGLQNLSVKKSKPKKQTYVVQFCWIFEQTDNN